MFKLFECITKITSIVKPFKKSSRGFNIAYAEPADNMDFLLLVAKKNFK